MATLEQIAATYDYLDEIVRLDMGEYGEVTCAFYDGDFAKTLEQAQRDKHEYILTSIGFREGDRVLDVGCGWGPLLKAISDRRGTGVGLTLSPKQAKACVRNGLDVRLQDWRSVDSDEIGAFDGIASVGAFEHFCSVAEYQAGLQEEVYNSFFQLCGKLLRPGGRLYLQTMMWGRNAPPYSAVSLKARNGSSERILAVLERTYPGSWLPAGLGQVEQCASPYFRLVSTNNGRKDYIETMSRWDRVWRWNGSKVIPALKMLRNFAVDPDFIYKLEALRKGYNKECFIREVMDHQRLVFESVES